MFEENSYETERSIAPPKGKLPFLKKVSFYMNFIRIVFYVRKGVLAGKGLDFVADNCCRILKMCEDAGGCIDIVGIDNLRQVQGGVVIAANHMSTIETVMFPAVLHNLKDQTYVVKRSLVTGKVFGPIMRLFNPIALDRQNPKVDLDKVMREGTVALQNGKSVVLFPQGTRLKGFDPATFNSLAVKLAKRAGVPVVPCAIKTDFWENGKILSTIGDIYPERTIHFAFGQAISVDGVGKKEQKQIVDFIDTHFKEWTADSK